MVLEKFFKSRRSASRRQHDADHSVDKKQDRRMKTGDSKQENSLGSIHSIEEIPTDSCYPQVNSEKVPLNIDETNMSASDEDYDNIDRKVRTLDCFCTIETNQQQKHSLYMDGYEQTPVISIEDAIIPLKHLLPDIDEKAQIAKGREGKSIQRKLKQRKMTQDESTAIRLYTMQWAENEPSLYWLLNKTLREANQREQMEPWFSYLKLFLSALIKLPSEKRTVWRGVKLDLSENYAQGQEITWWSISSCTENIRLLQQDQFLGQSGSRTLFSVECCRGKIITEWSDYPKEREIILLPGTKLVVVEKMTPAPDLHIIHLQEIVPEKPYLMIPMTEQEIKNERMMYHRQPDADNFQLVPIKPAKPMWQKLLIAGLVLLVVCLLAVAIAVPTMLIKKNKFATTTRPPQIYGNSTAVCHFHGDPHLLTFPKTPGEARSQYWCKTPGENLLLKNDYVEIKLHVTEKFWYNEQFEIILYGHSGEKLCTLTDQQKKCDNSNITVIESSKGKWIDIIYKTIGMRIQLRQSSVSSFFDISIHLRFHLIYVSEGLCISPNEQCEPESVGSDSRQNPLGNDREINISNDEYRKLCNLYLDGAVNAIQQLKMTYQPEMIDNLRISCLHDIMTTKNTTVGTASINVLVAEGVNALNPNDEQFEMIVKESVAVVNKTLEIINNQIKPVSDVKDTTLLSCYTCGSTSCTTDWWRKPEQRQRENGQVEVQHDYLKGAGTNRYRILKHVKAGAENSDMCRTFNTNDYYKYCCSSDGCNEQWIAQWIPRTMV